MNTRGFPILIVLAVLLAVGVLLLAGRYGSPAQAEETGGIIQPAVLVALQKSSEADVIINLVAVATPPPGLHDPTALDEYRRRVAAVQDRVLEKLTPSDFTLTYQFRVTTALLGHITETGVEKLRGHPDVAMVAIIFATPPGDANCDGTVNSMDAALVLQFDAALIQSLPCERPGDVYGDGEIDARDAAVILQIEAGLCCVWAWQ